MDIRACALRGGLSAVVLLASLCAACGVVVLERDGSGGGDDAPPSGPCPASEQEACYSGPAETEVVGACAAGVRYCAEDGASWSACIGEVVPRTEVCFTPQDESCDGVAECTGALVWARDLVKEDAEGTAAGVAVDPWGDVLVAGAFRGALEVAGLTLHSDDFAAFVLKIDAAGNGLWARQSNGPARGAAIAADANGDVLVAGAFHGSIDLGDGPLVPAGPQDVFLAKYDRDGGLLWSRGFGGKGHQWPEDMAVDAWGNALIIGGLHDGADFGDGYEPSVGETDVFVLKIGPAGERVYSKHFGSSGYDHGLGIAASESGAAVITGSFAGAMDMGGGPLVTAGSDDVFLAWLSPKGEHVWSRRIGGGGFDLGKGIALDPLGVIAVAGLSTGTVDFGGGPVAGGGVYDAFVAFYSSDGEPQGARVFGAPGATAEALDVAADGASQFVVTGHMSGTVSFGGAPLTSAAADGSATDVFVMKIGQGGLHAYSHVFGDGKQQLAWAIATDQVGSAVVAGSFRGAIDFGGGPLGAPGSGASDLFVAKLMP